MDHSIFLITVSFRFLEMNWTCLLFSGGDPETCRNIYMKLLIACVVLLVTADIFRMYYTLSWKLFWTTLLLTLGFWGGWGCLSNHREWGWGNEFVLGQQVAKAFNLTSCWVCGGPFCLVSWPFTCTEYPSNGWWVIIASLERIPFGVKIQRGPYNIQPKVNIV